MQELRLRLRAGADPKRAADVLNESIMTAGNITAYGAGIGSEITDGLRNAYLNWAEALELQLQALTLDSAVVAALHTERYWRIRTLDDDPRPYRLVDAEVKHQVARLQALLDDLNELGRLTAAPGHIAVLDTNILLEFLPPDQLPWGAVLGLSPVRLVVPLRVVEELDAKKYARRADLAERARRILPQLEAAIGKGGVPGQLREGVTIEVPVDRGSRFRPMDADEEILDTCRELSQLTGRAVTLVTADTAMRLRAEAQALPVTRLPDAYLRRPTGMSAADENERQTS